MQASSNRPTSFMSSTDYVLRVLFDRLARAFQVYLDSHSGSGSGSLVVPEYTTVALMLAADVDEIPTFAKCANYSGTDENQSLWMKSGFAVADNGTDVRESTHTPGIFFERVWVRENL